MDAVILDVGGVLLVPHFETVNPALEEFGVALDLAGAERAHYFGARALDHASDDPFEERAAYLLGYTTAAGVDESMRDSAMDSIRRAWAHPNIDVWRQHVRGSVNGLWSLAKHGVKLGSS